MSMPRTEKAVCPKCGREFEYTMWQSINTQMRFAIPDIISGKLFEAVCPGCGETYTMDYPILFNDMLHKVMIHYVAEDDVDEAIKAVGLSKALGYRIRVVTSQYDLREKTAIFNAGLDDRVVELMKYVVVTDNMDKLGGREIEYVLFDPDGDDSMLEVLTDDGAVSYMQEVMPVYETIEEHIGDMLASMPDEEQIDLFWAREFVKSLDDGGNVKQ